MGEASPDVVEQVELQHANAKQRVQLWKQIATKHASDKGIHMHDTTQCPSLSTAAWVDEHAAHLTQLAVAAAAAQTDAATTRAASQAVHAALHSGAPAFLRSLSAALVKAASLPSLLPGHALLLVRWVSAVLQSIDAAAAEKVRPYTHTAMGLYIYTYHVILCMLAALHSSPTDRPSHQQAAPTLLQCQATFMAFTTPPGAPRTVWVAAVHSVLSTLRTTPTLLPAYASAAAAHSGPALAHVLALYVAVHEDEATSKALVQLYCTRVLSSKEALSAETCALYAPLLHLGMC